MPAPASNKEKSQAPVLATFQFDAAAIGDAVNLFRGNLAFPLKVLSLPSRGGLSLDVTLLYQSNVQFEVDTWNLHAQTDVVGLGWSLPYEKIVVDPKANGSPLDDDYYLYFQGQSSKLVPIPQSWARGTLSAERAALVRPGKVSPTIVEGFLAQGIGLSREARIEGPDGSGRWTIYDDARERIFTLEKESEGGARISTGGLCFELANYQFWQISFFEAYNSWEIRKEDGTVYTYGGTGTPINSGESPNVVQWGIKWGNWIGNSTNAAGQARYPIAWNLARIENPVGNYIDFNYLVTEQTVGTGSLTYTKECHLEQAKNDLGWSCAFAYKPITYDNSSLDGPKEFLDPHKDPATLPDTAPDAYQSRYITQYLDRITVLNDAGAEQLYLQLDYYPLQNLTIKDPKNLLGYGATYKRYLKSITQCFPSGLSKPGIHFTYDFSTDTSRNRGALTQILYPAGGGSVFEYALISVGADDSADPGARNRTIPNPFGDLEGHPRIWYGGDYVVCGWYDDTKGALKINVFTWVGRWSQWQSDWLTFDVTLDLDRLQAATSENTFLLSIPYLNKSQSDVYLFHRKPLSVATWEILTQDGQPRKYTYDSKKLQISTGNDFFVVNDTDNNVVDRYAWNWMEREWEAAHLGDKGALCRSSTSSSYIYYITAEKSYYLIHCYDKINQISKFSLFYRDPLLQWQAGGTLETSEIRIPSRNGFSYFNFSPGESFAAMAYVTGYTPYGSGFKAFDYELRLLTWDEKYQSLAFADLPDLPDEGFQNVPQPIIQSIGPVLIDNTLLGSGPNVLRYDGEAWSYEFLGIKHQVFSDFSIQYYWYAYAEDAAAKTENTLAGVYSTLTSMNVSRPDEGWQTQVLEDVSPPPSPGRETMAFPTLIASYLSQGTNIYNRSVYPDWKDVGQYLLDTLGETALDTTTILNQPPHFLAFMTLDEDGNPKATSILFYKNGDLIRDADGNPEVETFDGQQMFRFLNRQHHYAAALDGKLPAIVDGFMTYPVGGTIDEAKEITLHRYSNDSVQDPIKAFVVREVETDTGYGRMRKCYDYRDISSAMDSTGTIIRFQTVTEFDGCRTPEDQKNGFTTSHFYNGLPSDSVGLLRFPSQSDVTECYSALDGMLVRKERYDATGNEVASTDNVWTVVDQVAIDAQGTHLRNLYGGIPQVQTTTEMLDGVSNETNYTYSTSSGQPSTTSTRYYGSTGEPITKEKRVEFAYEHYPEMWQQNLLKPVAQSTVRAKADSEAQWAIESIQVQTSKAWTGENGKTYWAESESYIPLEADAPDFTWWDGGSPGPKWRCTEEIVDRGALGQVLESNDVQGRPATTIYDQAGRFPIASFVNAGGSGDGVSYDSFEDYQPTGWRFSGSSGGGIIDTDSSTGKGCYEITRSGTLSKTLSVTSPTRSYLFTGWLKTPAGASSSSVSITFRISDSGSGRQISKSFGLTVGKWDYAQWVADLSQLDVAGPTELNLEIEASISGSGIYVRLDDIFFTPLDSELNAWVFDGAKLRRIASLQANGATTRQFYDQFDQEAGEVGVYGNTLGFKTDFLTRQTTDMSNGAPFPASNPNLEVTVGGRDAGFYDEFKADALESYDFINSSPGDWKVVNHQLHLTGASSAPLGAQVQRKDFQHADLGVYVLVDSDPANVVSLGTGSFFVKWDGTTWQLLHKSGDQLLRVGQNTTVGFVKEWILVVFENRLMFFVDGILLFNYASDDVASQSHGVLLGLQNPASFYNLLVVEDLSLSLAYKDGLDRTIQSLAMETGNSAILTAWLYDALGNKAITIKPSRVTTKEVENPFQFYEGYVTNGGFDGSVWQDEPMTGPAAEIYHPADGGYPFNRTVYEPSPLQRVAKQGKPGSDFAVARESGRENPHVDSFSYGKNEDAGPFLYPLAVGQYHVERHTDANGNVTVTYTDADQHLIGTVVLPPGSDDESSHWRTSKVYDSLGRPIASIPPNYYSQSSSQGSSSSDIPPDATTVTYDFLGQRIGMYSPDQGTSRCIYDLASQPRFMQDERGRQEGCIQYIKYDRMNRVVEEGYYTAQWDQETLQDKANNDPDWPDAPTTWSTRSAFDGDDTRPNMVGRLWQAFANNAETTDPDVLDTLAYDRLGKVVSKSRRVVAFSNSETYTIEHTYNCTGTLLSSTDSVTGLKESRVYNHLGQLTGISGIVDSVKTELLQLSYTQEGQQESARLMPSDSGELLQRTFQYNSPGWLDHIEDPAVTESLEYTQGSCEKSGYYNGMISHQTVEYEQGREITDDYCFTVDSLNRMTQAGEGPDANRWEMDDNGNFRTHSIGSMTRTYRYDSSHKNQVQSVTSSDGGFNRSYTYNPNGDILDVSSGGAPLMHFDYFKCSGKARTITLSGNPSADGISLQYDPAGLRTLKTVSEGATQSQSLGIWSLGQQPSVEIDRSSGTERSKRMIFVPGTIIIYVNGTYYFGLPDHLGSTRILMDGTGKIAGQYDYDIYGAPDVVQSPDFLFRLLYTGQCYDAETGLYDYKARMYDPVIARFLMVDPELEQPSPYVYVGNNPMMMTDPTGQMGVGWWIGAIAGGIAATLLVGVGLGAVVGTGLIASIAVGMVAGVAGSMASHAFTAAGRHEKYFSKSLLIDMAAGAAGGIAGAGAGGATGRLVMRGAMKAGLGARATTALGAGTSGLSGGVAGGAASSGVTAGAYHQPFFSKSTAMNMTIGGVAGLGGGLLAAGAQFGFSKPGSSPLRTMPVEIRQSELNTVGFVSTTVRGSEIVDLNPSEFATTTGAHLDAVPRINLPGGGHIDADVVVVHGFWRHVFAEWGGQYNRYMTPETLGELIQTHTRVGVAGRTGPIKLISCHGGSLRMFSVAQRLANVLQREVYAPTTSIPVTYQGPWLRFTPH